MLLFTPANTVPSNGNGCSLVTPTDSSASIEQAHGENLVGYFLTWMLESCTSFSKSP